VRGDDATGGERQLVLRNLIALGQVGIEVVLAREDRSLLDGAAERQRRTDRVVDRGVVQYRQRARQAETDRTDVGVGRRAERRAGAAEDLRRSQELVLKFSTNMRASLAACAS
jgi:hypothetical protein